MRANDFVGEDFEDKSGLIERGGTSRETAAIQELYNGANIYGDFTITTGAIADIVEHLGLSLEPHLGFIALAEQVIATRTLFPDGIEGAFT